MISCSKSSNEISYPTSKKNDFTETIHGYEISDSYRWLEEFTSDESTAWVNKQNKFSKKFISKNKFKREISNYLEKIWENDFWKITLGSNFRIYTPKSGGSLFSDTNSITTNGDTIINRIINKEVGSYLGVEKSFLSDQLILKGSMRLDKNLKM